MMVKHPEPPTTRRPGQSGFTLIEIMVALAIGMVILTALAIVFARNSGNQAELERTTRQLENARFALDELTEDIMHAGYYGDFNPDTMATAPTYGTPDPCADEDGLGWTTPAAPAAVSLPVAVQGIAAGTVIGCGAARRAGTQSLMVRRADTGAALTPATVVPGNLYVQASRCTTDLERLKVGKVAADFTLHLPNCTGINPIVRRVVQRTYYVATCNDCSGAGDGIPTLKRIEWIDNGRRDTPLAEGIENLQFEFGVDTTPAPPNGDGQPDVWVGPAGITDAPGAGPLSWDNVVAVRVHLLARSTQSTPGYSDTRTYSMGGVNVTPQAGFRYTLLTSTVRLINVGGRRE